MNLIKSLPKWSFMYNKVNKILYIKYKYFNWSMNIRDICIKDMKDVHDSIDFVEDFLNLNNFKKISHETFARPDLKIMVIINCDRYLCSVNKNDNSYNYEELLLVLKDALQTEFVNKVVKI